MELDTMVKEHLDFLLRMEGAKESGSMPDIELIMRYDDYTLKGG